LPTSQTATPSSQQPSVEAALDLAVAEIFWRLEDHERRAAIPDHVLKTYLVEANKVADRRRAEAENKPGGPELGVLDLIATTNLPAKRKDELIRQELERVRRYERELVSALAEGELHNG